MADSPISNIISIDDQRIGNLSSSDAESHEKSCFIDRRITHPWSIAWPLVTAMRMGHPSYARKWVAARAEAESLEKSPNTKRLLAMFPKLEAYVTKMDCWNSVTRPATLADEK